MAAHPGALSCSLVVGATRSKGMELDVGGELLPGWNVILAYTNMDARITQTSPDRSFNKSARPVSSGRSKKFGKIYDQLRIPER